jgi:hypothetical protein
MRRGAEIVSVLSVLFAVSVSSCGGGGGSSSPGVSSPYSGITTAAVVTDNNAVEIALAAFQAGDLGANAVVPLAPAGGTAVRQTAAMPAPLALVRTVSKAAVSAIRPPAAAVGPSPRAPFTESGVIPDGQGGEARYTISGDDATGVFTGTFEFVGFHGDGGGVIAGAVAVSGAVTQNSMHILFDFRSVHIVDVSGGSDVTAAGTVDLVASMDPATGTDTATLNLFFTDNVTRETVWLSDYHLTTIAGAGYSDVTLSGRIYLHDYGYVDIASQIPFRYLDGVTFPASGQMTVTGQANRGVRLTADSQTQCTLDADLDGDGLYDELTVTVYW